MFGGMWFGTAAGVWSRTGPIVVNSTTDGIVGGDVTELSCDLTIRPPHQEVVDHDDYLELS